jgi:alkylhydroperoxidase/carboxymuconolactone decarboxylase family protein YurZ
MDKAGLDDLSWASELDPHYARLLHDFSHGGMFRRGILDVRTRCLVLVGEFVAMDEMEELGAHIRVALEHGVAPREILEVILQTTVYFGYPKAKRGARELKRVLNELGRMDEIASTQLPDGGPERSLEREREAWKTPVEQVPRREALLAKYGWRSLSPGLRLQPTHHLQSVARLDRIDPHFNKLWLDFIYAGMYSRGVLDDRTRILCIVGELFVVGEFHQAENHIRNALQHGASGREVLEVILQSTIYAGMPRFVRFVTILEHALEEQGRLHEITETQLPLPG